jgi:hypothetical protein
MLVLRIMAKKVLARKTSRGAAKTRRIGSAGAMRYAGSAVQTLGSLRENPQMFGFGHYEHYGVPSLEEATLKAKTALSEGRLRAAVTYAVDLSDLLAKMPSEQKMPGGDHYEAAEEAREVGDLVIARLQESLRSAAR